MEKKPMARNKALVAEDVAVVAAAALVMEKFCRWQPVGEEEDHVNLSNYFDFDVVSF